LYLLVTVRLLQKCNALKLTWGLSIKDVRTQREFVQCGHFANKGGRVLQMRIPHFLMQNIGFFEIYGVSARTEGEGVELVRTFADKGGGQFFAILCGRHVWTAPCVHHYNVALF